MNIHEYQAKALLKTYHAPVAKGMAVFSANEIASACAALSGPVWVVKSQIHAGGRGKGRFKEASAGDGGGIRIARSAHDAEKLANQMLGKTLLTHQTGAEGKTVRTVYIEAGADIARELYLSMLVDRGSEKIAIIASTEGGTDIEQLAAERPDRIHTELVDLETGIADEALRNLVQALALDGTAAAECRLLLRNLFRAFIEKDMSLLEINPLIVTLDGHVQVLDAKISFDPSALYRHQDMLALRDEKEEDPREREAAKWDLAYIALDGNIGCMVNGAGLAMASMDIIKLYGASPANFCDVGGGASTGKVSAAFRIILQDPNVKGILVNIFGGIMRCDVVADGILEAVKEIHLPVPLVVRLEGTNVEKGKAIIEKSGLNIIPASDLDEAAQKIVAAIN